MLELDQNTITDVSLEQMASTKDQRFKELMDAAVRYLHAYAREVDLKPAELIAGLLETVVNILNDLRRNEPATRTSLLGPFHVNDAPPLESCES